MKFVVRKIAKKKLQVLHVNHNEKLIMCVCDGNFIVQALKKIWK